MRALRLVGCGFFSGPLVLLVGVGFALRTADAQSLTSTLSFTGSGSGNASNLSLNGSGTFTPYGSANVTITGGGGSKSLSLNFVFTFADGDTVDASGAGSTGANLISGTATVNGGTGAFVGATGSFNYSISAPVGTTSSNVQFTLTGSGSIITGQTTSCALQMSSASLTFAAFSGGDSAPAQTLTIVTSCSSAVNYAVTVDAGTAGSAAPSWISVTPSSGVTPGTLTVSVTPGTMATAIYAATIHITVPGSAAQAPINVTVTFMVSTASPQLQVSPTSLTFGARVQTPAVQTQAVVMRNSGGGGSINYSSAIVGNSSWISSVSPGAGQALPNAPVLMQVVLNSQDLAIGNYHDTIRITWSGGTIDIAVSLFVSSQGAILSVTQNGVLFESRQGNGNGQTQSVSVFDLGDPSSSVNFSASVVTGSDWAILGNANGMATPGSPGSFSIKVGGDASTLPVGGAYALIKITDTNTVNPALNSPQYLVAVLSIEPASNPPEPHPYPAGVYLTTGNSAQNVTVFTSSTTPANFQTSASTTDGAKWLTVTPASGIASTQTPAPISISASATGLANGVYNGLVNVSENGLVRSVNVTFLVTGQTTGPEAPRATGCTPSQVTIAQTALSSNFEVPAGWPASLIVQLNDDCGNPVSNGSVVASFSNGDPPLTLSGDQHSNIYSTTWQPSTVIPSMTVTIRGASGALQPAIQQYAGAVDLNAFAPPTLIPNGTLDIFFNLPTAQALGNGLAPGNVVQVFGTGLASTAESPGVVPLVNSFNGTFMLIGGVQVPLYFVSPNQLDIQIPFELASNKQYTAIVSANGALTLPITLNVVPVQPGVAATADGSVIAQHAADFSLVTAAHPAKPNEPLIIYLAGMGVTNPPVPSGSATPGQLVPAVVQPTVTVDGQPAVIAYAGLTPTGIGLYQINFTVPAGARSGNLSVVVMQSGLASNTATVPVSN